MANALETTVTTGSQVASKAESLQEAIDQVANAVNLPNPIDLSGGGPYALTTDDLYRHAILEFTGVSGAIVDVTWPANEARQILVFCDETNTHNVEVTHGTTTYALEPGGAYWLYSNGDTNHLKALHIALLGAGAGYVNKAGDTMTGDLLMEKALTADTRYVEFNVAGSARARIGTFGTNDFIVRVSPDGSAFVDAITIDDATGNVGLGIVPTTKLDLYSSATLVVNITSDNAVILRTERYSNNAAAPSISTTKGRGTRASPSQALANDGLFELEARGFDDSGTPTRRTAGRLALNAASNITSTSAEGRLVLTLCGSGSVSLNETFRVDRATGMSYDGANPFLNQDRGVVLRSTTIAGVASLAKTTGTKYWISDYRGGVEAVYDGTNMVIPGLQYLTVAASDETTAITAGTGKIKVRAPCQMKLSSSALPRASLSTAQTSGSTFTVDINEGDTPTTILTTKLTIDNTEKTSTTAATPCVLSDTTIADDAEISIDVDTVGDGTAKGLKVTIPYREVVA